MTEEEMLKISRLLTYPLLVLLPLLLVLMIGGCSFETKVSPEATPTPGLPPEFDSLLEAWQILQSNAIYGDDLDAEALSQGAIRGMMQALDDPYAAYMDPEIFRVQQEDMGGSFEGIGARIAVQDDWVIILAPLDGSPAERAGIKPGDIIMEVDGEDTIGMSLYEVVALVRGPAGTTVSLGMLHEGDDEIVTIPVVRERIDVPSVTLEDVIEGGIAHITISEFSEDTDEEMSRILSELKDQGIRGLILDMRYNPGGILDSVVNTASLLLEEGLVLYEIDSEGSRRDWEVRDVDETARLVDLPIMVLVNRFSASGAEVLAGALRDHGKAVVIGEKTFGKGSVNSLHPLTDGSAVYYTIAHWYTPNGTLIEGEGLQPDIVIEPQTSPSEDDLYLEEALKKLRAELETH
jgi:carboxyl-terminal processing protease